MHAEKVGENQVFIDRGQRAVALAGTLGSRHRLIWTHRQSSESTRIVSMAEERSRQIWERMLRSPHPGAIPLRTSSLASSISNIHYATGHGHRLVAPSVRADQHSPWGGALQRDLQLAKHGAVQRSASYPQVVLRTADTRQAHGPVSGRRVSFGFPGAMSGAHKPQAAPLQDAHGDGLPGWPSAAVSAAAAMQAGPHAIFAATSAPPGNEIYEMSSAAAAAAAAAGAAAAAAAYRRSPPRMRAPPSLGLRTVASDVFAPRQDSIAKLRASLDGALAESATAREASRRAEHEATAELGRTVWPTQLAGLCARAIVLHVLKAAALVRSTAEQLEHEANAVHAVHAGEAQAQWERAATSFGNGPLMAL